MSVGGRYKINSPDLFCKVGICFKVMFKLSSRFLFKTGPRVANSSVIVHEKLESSPSLPLIPHSESSTILDSFNLSLNAISCRFQILIAMRGNPSMSPYTIISCIYQIMEEYESIYW